MFKYPLQAPVQKSVQNFFAKIVQSAFFWMLKTNECKKVKILSDIGKIWHSGSMPEDSGSKYKSPGFNIKWESCIFFKSQKAS